MPSGESFIRQFLYGQNFFQEEFNKRCSEVNLFYHTFVIDIFRFRIIKPNDINFLLIKLFKTPAMEQGKHVFICLPGLPISLKKQGTHYVIPFPRRS